ncbi:MAG: hypothetical protein ACLQAH_07020 [Limisphaerales bacterium]
MRLTLIIGASVCCAIGLLMGLLLFGTQDFKNASGIDYAFWSAYILLAFAPLFVLYRSRPQLSRRLLFSIAGLIEVCVIGFFVMMMFPRL